MLGVARWMFLPNTNPSAEAASRRLLRSSDGKTTRCALFVIVYEGYIGNTNVGRK